MKEFVEDTLLTPSDGGVWTCSSILGPPKRWKGKTEQVGHTLKALDSTICCVNPLILFYFFNKKAPLPAAIAACSLHLQGGQYLLKGSRFGETKFIVVLENV